jgi:hypothetical protein
MYDDPIVDEVRKTRERLAEAFDFDAGAIFADLRREQAKLGTRLVRRQRKRAADQTAAPDRDSAARDAGR